MKNTNTYEMDKKQLEMVTGGDSVLDPNNMTQEERIAELEQRLKEFMKTKQGQNLGLPDNQPNGGFLGGGFGDCFGNNPAYDPNALQ